MKPTRVLIVDDSEFLRSLLSRLLKTDPSIEIVGMAADAYEAREMIVALEPDVITLDIEMPKLDGLSFLDKLMRHHPIRVLVLSTRVVEKPEYAARAFEAGAVDVMPKPKLDSPAKIGEMARDLAARIKRAARAPLNGSPQPTTVAVAPSAGLKPMPQAPFSRSSPGGAPGAATSPASASSIAPFAASLAAANEPDAVIAIASSTGGTEALKEVIPLLPADSPPIVIVQHMPPVFTRVYAEALDKMSKVRVREAWEGDELKRGLALIAPGNYHMEIVRAGHGYRIELHQKPPIHGVRPAADFLMKSVAHLAGAKAIGVVLTGMGRDGAAGLLAMREAGAFTIAQDEASCVVYGMPKAAAEIGAAQRVLPLSQIAAEIERLSHLKTAA